MTKLITKEKAQEIIKASKWSVKGVKFMKGHDADSMSCSLYHKKKRVVTVWDDSWGGEFMFTWLKNKKELEKKFDDFAESLFVKSEHFEKGMTYNADIVVDELVNDFELQKQYKNMCRNKTSFQLDGDGKDQFWTMKTPFTPKIKAYLVKKYGKKLTLILNEVI